VAWSLSFSDSFSFRISLSTHPGSRANPRALPPDPPSCPRTLLPASSEPLSAPSSSSGSRPPYDSHGARRRRRSRARAGLVGDGRHRRVHEPPHPLLAPSVVVVRPRPRPGPDARAPVAAAGPVGSCARGSRRPGRSVPPRGAREAAGEALRYNNSHGFSLPRFFVFLLRIQLLACRYTISFKPAKPVGLPTKIQISKFDNLNR
jgi:hypothetical protein